MTTVPNSSEKKPADLSHDELLARYAELSRRLSLLNAGMDVLPPLVSYVDKDLIYRFTNRAFLNWHGKIESEFVGKQVREVIGDTAMTVARPFLKRALAGEKVEYTNHVPREGSLRTLRVAYFPDAPVNGQIPGLLATVTDITEQEFRLNQIEESEKRLQLIFNNAPVGIIQLDEDRRFISANPAYLKFIGYSFEELRQMTMFQVTHPDDLALTKKLSEGFTKDGFWIRRLEKRYLRKGGEIIWGMVTSQQVQNPQTGRMNLFTVIEDITEFKEKELALKRAEAEITHFFSVSLDLMCVFDKQSLIKRVNSAFLTNFGYAPHNLLGHSIFEFVHPEDVESTRKQFESGLQGVPTLKFENRCRTVSGEYRLISWNAAPDFETELIYASGRDITEKRFDEIKMAYSSKMASLGEMAGGVAHEINNPLAIILGKVNSIQLHLDAPHPDFSEIKQELTNIERTGLRIAKIIRGLRAFSRNGESDPMNRVPLLRIIEDTLELCSERLKSRFIDLQVNCPADILVNCRPSQLSQVLMNLISNSYDAIENLPSPWIKIVAANRGGGIQLIVEDCGLGIPPDVREKMMQPFFTTKEVGRGTGLGLSISNGIVEEHGGQLLYDESSPNTRFIIELPSPAP